MKKKDKKLEKFDFDEILQGDENYNCEENHTCNCKEEGHECHCHEEGHECTCGDDCKCNEESHECQCHEEECDCEECSCEAINHEEEYLNMARVIQADFDNYRKKSYEQILLARQEGIIQGIEAFLPALDSFNEAKKMITDEKVLEGVEMIEKKIVSALEGLGVEKIEAEGKTFDHNLHSAILISHDNSLEDDVITAEYQAGYKFKDKVIRYSQVIVNKKEEN